MADGPLLKLLLGRSVNLGTLRGTLAGGSVFTRRQRFGSSGPPIERAGLLITDIESLRLHHAETLQAWRERFLAHREG